ncbi:MAG: amidohydrolase family protein [Bacillota bacterium]
MEIIVDCHCHLDENMLPLEMMIRAMDKNGVGKTALMAKLCEPFYMKHNLKNRLMSSIFRKSLLGFNSLGKKIYDGFLDKKGNFLVLGETSAIVMRPDNAPLVEAVKKYPGRFWGWITINPEYRKEAAEEIEKYASVPEMIGVKVHPFFHKYDIEVMDWVAALCSERKMPLLIHLSSQEECYRYLPDKYPGLKVIYAHAGIPHFKKLWAYIKTKKNVYVDLSGGYLDAGLAEMAVRNVGYEKCLYGTDGPYGISHPGGDYDYSEMKDWVEGMKIPDGQKRDILGNNFLSIIS